MQNYPSLSKTNAADVVRTFMARTYSWMAAGLALTAGVALIIAQNKVLTMQIMELRMPLFFLQLAMVLGLGFLAPRIPSVLAGILFMVYATVTGLVFSSLLFAYSPGAVITAFASTAGTFGIMSVLGFVIKKDLSGMGRFFMFALIGFIIAVVANMFIGSSLMTTALSVFGVVLFAGLTTYETQMLKNMALSGIEGEGSERAAVHGALMLYINFINIFISLLGLTGGRD